MNKFSYLTLLTLLLLLPACQKQAELIDETEARTYPDFVATAPFLRVLDDRWEAGDQIGIFSSRETDVPYVTAHGDGTFAPRGDRRISMAPEGETFHAYYPYSYGGGGSVSFDLRDQCPLLYGEGKGVRGETQVELSFSHRLSQLRVRLVSEIEGIDLSDARVELQGYRSGGRMEKRSGTIDPGTAVHPLPSSRIGNTFLTYILPGETIGDPTHKVQIEVGTKSILLTEPAISGVTETESGKYYEIVLHLKRSPSEPASGDLSASIRSFVEGGTIEGDIFIDPEPSTKRSILLEEHFDSSLGEMTNHTILGKGIGFEAEEGCATVTGRRIGMTKILLMSPAFDFTDVSGATLSFVHSISRGKRPSEEQMLYVTTEGITPDYPEEARWTRVEIPKYPAVGSEDFVPNSIPLPNFVYGQKQVRFAFVYKSRDYQEALWRIDDVVLRVGESDTSQEGPVPPDPGTIPAKGLLFPGADCESEPDLRTALGKQGLRSYAILSRDHAFPDRGQVLSVVKQLSGNDYLLSFKGAIPSGARLLTFLLKGASSARSLSVNVYGDHLGTNGQQSYVCYNLGEVSSHDKVLRAEPRNLYKGTIDTRGQWITVTLDLTSVDLNTDPAREMLAIKLGGASDVALMLDDFRFR